VFRSAAEDSLPQSAPVVDEPDLVDTEEDMGGSAGGHDEAEEDGGINGEGGEEADGEEDVEEVEGDGDGNGAEGGTSETHMQLSSDPSQYIHSCARNTNAPRLIVT
jgi:hypothetical protein